MTYNDFIKLYRDEYGKFAAPRAIRFRLINDPDTNHDKPVTFYRDSWKGWDGETHTQWVAWGYATWDDDETIHHAQVTSFSVEKGGLIVTLALTWDIEGEHWV